jgi:hypothetical protein
VARAADGVRLAHRRPSALQQRRASRHGGGTEIHGNDRHGVVLLISDRRKDDPPRPIKETNCFDNPYQRY